MAVCSLSSSYDNPDNPVMGHAVCVGQTRLTVYQIFCYFENGMTNEQLIDSFPSLAKYDVALLRRLYEELKGF